MINYKHNEDKILDAFRAYVDGTYGEHYAGKESEVQVVDIWRNQGIAKAAYMSNISKYAFRFGKKDGENVKDLYKILHYTVMLINELERGKQQ